MKIEYTMPIRATVQGIHVEITAWTIQQALGKEGTRTHTVHKASKNLVQKYMTMFGLSKADHNTDRTRIKGF